MKPIGAKTLMDSTFLLGLRNASQMRDDENDEYWMARATKLAHSKGTQPSDTPIAAVIVLNGKGRLITCLCRI